MSLAVSTTYTALRPGLSVSVGATGGTEPYTYSLTSSDSGGSIQASTGLYTAGSATGVDVITVTDSTSSVASVSMLVDNPILLVCDIIQKAMGLSRGQVYLYNQKINIPTNSELYVAVGVLTAKPFGNRPKYVGGSDSFIAVQSVNMNTVLSIDILSRSTQALDRKEQVLMALSSPYAEQQMELNSFYVSQLSTSFVNLSSIDGAAIPYRFNISVALQYATTLTSTPPYFDTFSTPQVTTEP